MIKSELIDVVAEKAMLSDREATRAVTAVFDAIKQALIEGDEVRIVGFGTFDVKDRGERTGRNPSTGESLVIKACRMPHIKFSKQLREMLNP